MDSRLPVIENEIIKYFTGRDWKNSILQWCSPPDSAGYIQRIECMESNKDLNYENFTSDLKYHINLLDVLANCNLGPKLEANFDTKYNHNNVFRR